MSGIAAPIHPIGSEMRSQKRVLIRQVLELWEEEIDTVDIAQRLGIAESEAANLLARGRDQRHERRAGGR